MTQYSVYRCTSQIATLMVLITIDKPIWGKIKILEIMTKILKASQLAHRKRKPQLVRPNKGRSSAGNGPLITSLRA